MVGESIDYCWRPQEGTQLKAITATWCEEVFFGGARGGGKTDFLLGDFAQDVNIYKNNWHGIFFRKTYPELDHAIQRSKEIYSQMGGIWQVQAKTWKFPSGATLKMRSMDREDDADKYQGHQYQWIGFDELPNWSSPVAYDKLKACLRSAVDIPYKRVRSSGNPGGVGQDWVKERFINPYPQGFKPIEDIKYINLNTGVQIELEEVTEQIIRDPAYKKIKSTRLFIPSRLQDNKILMQNDPFYIAKLAQSGGKELVKAWLAGDWDAIEGQYFDDFDKNKHIISDFIVPDGWHKIRAFDWGYSRPFCVLWGAVSDGSLVNVDNKQVSFPKGSIIIYREYYGTTGKANEGIKINADEIARNIKEMQSHESINDQVADPAIFDVSVGHSINEQMNKEGVYWRPADNKRVAGWQQIRSRLKGVDNKPLLFIMTSCKSLIRTLPAMQYDIKKPEDLDTDGEDHACDTLRYLCMSRPITVDLPKQLPEIAAQWWKDFNPSNVRENKMNTGFDYETK